MIIIKFLTCHKKFKNNFEIQIYKNIITLYSAKFNSFLDISDILEVFKDFLKITFFETNLLLYI